MRKGTLFIVLTTIVSALVASGAPALASTPPPTHEVITDPAFFQQNFAWNRVDCGSFVIHETVVSARREATTYYNEAGDEVLVFEHYSWEGVFTNLSNGNTLRDHFAANYKFPIESGNYTVYTAAGITFHFVMPHQGLVSPTLVGRYIYNVDTGEVLFSAGPHPDGVYAFEQFDPTAFCPLLA